MAEKGAGSEWSLVGLELSGATAAAHGDKLTATAGGTVAAAGFVTSGLLSGSIGRNIALASVKAGLGFDALGASFEVSLSATGGTATATVVPKPFVNPARKSQTPAPALAAGGEEQEEAEVAVAVATKRAA